MHTAIAVALALTFLGQVAYPGCADRPDPCSLVSGTYHIALPSVETPKGTMVWLHGAGGSGAGAMRGGMKETILSRGYALIAVDGEIRPGRSRTGWYFHPNRPKNRDDVAFIARVAQDAADRFGLDRSQMMLAGFSVGGSMTSYLACATPGAFFAYAPVAGSFWKPEPTECAGSVRLFHTHGWTDQTVPLEGRPLGNGQIYQGDVWQAMQVWRAENDCAMMRPDSFEVTDQFWRRKWDDCADQTALEFALHPDGHGIPRGWADMALNWFETLGD